MIRAFIFDLDGTLVETEMLKAQAYAAVSQTLLGLDAPDERAIDGYRRIVGATDEIASEAVEIVHPIRDVHVTMLHLLGLDDNKLTYFHGGRFKQLSQFGGKLITEIMA